MKKILLLALLASTCFTSLEAQKSSWGIFAGANTGVYTGKDGGVLTTAPTSVQAFAYR